MRIRGYKKARIKAKKFATWERWRKGKKIGIIRSWTKIKKG